MHISLRELASKIAPAVAAAALVFGSAQPVYADIPLPIIDVVPQQFFSTGSDAVDPNAPNPSPGDNNLVIGGTVTLPIFSTFSFSYDRIVGGAFDTALGSIGSIPGIKTLYPGPAYDLISNYRADYRVGKTGFNLELGEGSRHRMCCPYGGLEWHKGFLGVSYATPHFAFLNNGFFVLGLTGNTYNHFSSPEALTGIPPGLSLPNKRYYTTNQAVTAIVPVDLKHGVRTATTFLWGALDYPENGPFPYYYDVWILSGTKQFTDNIGLTAEVTNVVQRLQGYPFPSPGAIHSNAFAIAADFHLDFHKLLGTAPRETKSRSTQPGTPGGPGGPAPVGPTQGGAVPSPAPSPSPSP
jgi:hypothetical protein